MKKLIFVFNVIVLLLFTGSSAKLIKINSVSGQTVDDVGPWVDVMDYDGSFSDAIVAIGSDNKTLLIPNELSIASDVTVPSNISVLFLKGGSLNISSGVTVTINGSISSGLYQIFSKVGNIRITHNNTVVYAVWWRHSTTNCYKENDNIIGKTMDAIPNGGTVKLLAGTYIHKLIEVGNDVILQGIGYSTVIKLPDNLLKGAGIGLCGITAKDGAERVTVRDLQYDGNGSNNRKWVAPSDGDYDQIQAYGIYFGHFGGRIPPRYAQVENVYVHDVVRSNITWGGRCISPGAQFMAS